MVLYNTTTVVLVLKMPKRTRRTTIKAVYRTSKKAKLETPLKSKKVSSSSDTKSSAAAAASSLPLALAPALAPAPLSHQVRSTTPPTFIFQHVGYTEKNKARQLASGSEKTLPQEESTAAVPSENNVKSTVVKFIEKRFDIPNDFERPLNFGPVSGSNYSTRLIQSFIHDRLPLKRGAPELGALDEHKLQELLDQGFQRMESSKLLRACGSIVKDALNILSEN